MVIDKSTSKTNVLDIRESIPTSSDPAGESTKKLDRVLVEHLEDLDSRLLWARVLVSPSTTLQAFSKDQNTLLEFVWRLGICSLQPQRLSLYLNLTSGSFSASRRKAGKTAGAEKKKKKGARTPRGCARPCLPCRFEAAPPIFRLSARPAAQERIKWVWAGMGQRLTFNQGTSGFFVHASTY